MAAPIYFFPAVRRESLVDADGKLIASKLREYGLEAIVGDVAPNSFFAVNHPTAGPGGRSGCFLSTNTNGAVHVRAGYYPDFQRWTKVRREPELWIGVDGEFAPTPADLARPRIIRGWLVKLADGNAYEIPAVRAPIGTTSLPQDIYRDLDGVLQFEVKPEYHALWERAKRLWDEYVPRCASADGLDWEIILDECLYFLGANYRIGSYEQAALRLIDTDQRVWCGVLMAVIDRPFTEQLEQAQKKTDSPPLAC